MKEMKNMRKGIRRKATATYNLQTVFPAVAKEWHPTQNAPLTAQEITPYSRRKVWWQCKEGHEWEARVFSRGNGTGCPYCAGNFPSKTNNLQVANPQLCRQWHKTKNGTKTPRDFTPYSRRKVWWQCEKGHSWEASINSRNHGTGCPYCSGQKVCSDNCLETLNPALAKQWHPTKNGKLTPRDLTPNSCRKVWWICKEGHAWLATPNNRNHGTGCPYCSKRFATKENNLQADNPSLAKEWHAQKNSGLAPRDVTPHSNKKVWWKCDKGHVWLAIIKDRNRGSGCPKCRALRLSKLYKDRKKKVS